MAKAYNCCTAQITIKVEKNPDAATQQCAELAEHCGLLYQTQLQKHELLVSCWGTREQINSFVTLIQT